jgi:hypothetical protein
MERIIKQTNTNDKIRVSLTDLDILAQNSVSIGSMVTAASDFTPQILFPSACKATLPKGLYLVISLIAEDSSNYR